MLIPKAGTSFSPEISREGILEAMAEDHGRSIFPLAPTVEIAVAILPGAAKILSRKDSKPRPPAIDWIAVGRRIRGLRGFDITQADFASRIGVSQSYLSAVERGRNEVGAEVLLAISREFDKSLDWLLTGEE